VEAAAAEDIVVAIRRASIAAVSAVMRVEVTGDVGYLFFMNGEIVHASTLELEGELAVSEILGWGEAPLAWCERRWPRERSVHRDWSELAPTIRRPRSVAPATFEPEPDPQQQPSRANASELHFPSAFALRQALDRAEFRNVLRLTANGNVSDSRGSSVHLKPILCSTLTLGDSLGAVLGLGPLIGAEASTPGFHRLIARSSEDSSAVETAGGSSLQLARAFLKL